MGYKRWSPGSRRDRRRSARGPRRRRSTRGADRTFLLAAGLFLLVLIVVLAALASFGNAA